AIKDNNTFADTASSFSSNKPVNPSKATNKPPVLRWKDEPIDDDTILTIQCVLLIISKMEQQQ
ncbi:8865_t:CDS:2, partial [Funneliformis caledonium]